MISDVLLYANPDPLDFWCLILYVIFTLLETFQLSSVTLFQDSSWLFSCLDSTFKQLYHFSVSFIHQFALMPFISLWHLWCQLSKLIDLISIQVNTINFGSVILQKVLTSSVNRSLVSNLFFQSIYLTHLLTKLSSHLTLHNQLLLLQQILLISFLLPLQLCQMFKLLWGFLLELLTLSLDLPLILSVYGIL